MHVNSCGIFSRATRSLLQISAACIPCLGVDALAAQVVCPSTLSRTLSPTDSSSLDRAGRFLAASADGRTVASGSWNHVHAAVQSGAVWVRSGVGDANEVERKIVPSNAFDFMGFSASLAMSADGDTLIVGCTPAFTIERVFVYRFDGQQWNEEWVVSETAGDDLGYSVAISADGDVFAAGAPMRSECCTIWPGGIYVYRRGSSGWYREALVVPTDVVLNFQIGNSIAMSGDGRYLAGRTFVSQNSPVPSGAVYIFEHNAGSWTQVAKLQEPVAYSNGGFGMALAMDFIGVALAAGNLLDSRLAHQQGAVTLFRRFNGVWAFDDVVLPSAPQANGGFGGSVALNAAGDTLFVGEASAAISGVAGAGKVDRFHRLPQSWQRVASQAAPLTSVNAGFGKVVRCSATGARWIASEPWADFNGIDSGVVHVFDSTCNTPVVYCTAQANTLGCTPQIGAQGSASLSSTSGFTVSSTNSRNRQNGMLIYGTSGRAALPWLGGTLCVAPPLRRTPLVNSGGSPAPANDCSGALLRDFNAWTFASNDPELFAGQHVRAQFYSRDPGASHNVNLSDAVEFYLEP